MIRIFEQDFEAMLRQYGNSINDKKQFTALVKDLFPQDAKNVNLILIAYNMGIAQDIQKASLINNTFAFRYVKQLMDNYGISRKNADWIVSIWCVCYGEKILGKRKEIEVQKANEGPSITEVKSDVQTSNKPNFKERKDSNYNRNNNVNKNSQNPNYNNRNNNNNNSQGRGFNKSENSNGFRNNDRNFRNNNQAQRGNSSSYKVDIFMKQNSMPMEQKETREYNNSNMDKDKKKFIEKNNVENKK